MKGWTLQVYLMELRKIITYRADFWVNFFGQTLFTIIVSYFLWKSIFLSQGVTEIKGYSLQQLILYYLLIPVIFKVQLGETIGSISKEIYEGGLNKFLLYPISFFKFKLITYLAHSTFFFLQLCLILFVYQSFFYDPSVFTFNILNFILFTLILFFCSITYFTLNSITEMVAFWADNIWSLGVITRHFTRALGGGLIPLAFFPQWGQDILAYTPFPYLLHFPMKVLYGNYTSLELSQNILVLCMWTLFFTGISALLWKKGTYKYSGIGI